MEEDAMALPQPNGKISLYKKKECIEKNIPEDQAVEKLIELIKANGDYTEK